MNTLILSLHILGAGFLFAVLVFAILMLFHKPTFKERLGLFRTSIKLGAGAIVWMIITGAGLFAQKPQDFKSSILFWIKIGLLILDIIVGFVLINRKVKTLESTDSGQTLKSSLLAWTIFNIIVVIVITVLSLFLPS